MKSQNKPTNIALDLRTQLMKLDPVSFAKNYLNIDGNPVDLSAGWKFWADIYRHIAISAFKRDSKPIVILKGRQCGCTQMAINMELYFATSGMCGTKNNPPVKIVHCFPALAQVQEFAKEKLSNAIRTSTDNYVQKQLYGYSDSGVRTQDDSSTLAFKQFKNECRLRVESNANNASRLQGSTNDILMFDEMARMYDVDCQNANRTLTASKYGSVGQGLQIYFGTPTQKGSYFWKIWASSDQRFYQLKCIHCAHYFQLYEYESDSWEQTWVSGHVVRCPSCEKLQNKSEAVAGGKWIITNTQMENGQEPKYVGYHISQLLIPTLPKEAIIVHKPGVSMENSDRIYKNEILGEFYSGADLPMSQDVIYSKCRELDKRLSNGIDSDNQVNTFLGIDWGAKLAGDESAGKSFSAFVVCSVDSSGAMRLLQAFTGKKNDIQYKKDVVDELFRRFRIKVAVADLGYANDIVPEIQKQYGARFIGCMNSASLVNPYKYDPEELRLISNSNLALEELFGLMRKGKVLFPWGDFEKISRVIEHCCSMERDTRVVNGQVINRFIKGTGPNDFLMALQYAWLAYKFYLTRGFSIKPHQLGGKSAGAILAHIPRL